MLIRYNSNGRRAEKWMIIAIKRRNRGIEPHVKSRIAIILSQDSKLCLVGRRWLRQDWYPQIRCSGHSIPDRNMNLLFSKRPTDTMDSTISIWCYLHEQLLLHRSTLRCTWDRWSSLGLAPLSITSAARAMRSWLLDPCHPQLPRPTETL